MAERIIGTDPLRNGLRGLSVILYILHLIFSGFYLLEGVIVWLKQELPDFRIAFFPGAYP